jgi:hypothetical protein
MQLAELEWGNLEAESRLTCRFAPYSDPRLARRPLADVSESNVHLVHDCSSDHDRSSVTANGFSAKYESQRPKIKRKRMTMTILPAPKQDINMQEKFCHHERSEGPHLSG